MEIFYSAVFRSNKELPNLGFSFFYMHSKKEDTRDLVVLILDLSEMLAEKTKLNTSRIFLALF